MRNRNTEPIIAKAKDDNWAELLVDLHFCDGDHEIALFQVPEAYYDEAVQKAIEGKDSYGSHPVQCPKTLSDSIADVFTWSGIPFRTLHPRVLDVKFTDE